MVSKYNPADLQVSLLWTEYFSCVVTDLNKVKILQKDGDYEIRNLFRLYRKNV